MAQAQEGWSRYRVWAVNVYDAQRLTDSNLELFSESVRLGPTDVVVGPAQLSELQRLRLPYLKISDLPRPDAWKGYVAPRNSDYRSAYLRYNEIIGQYEQWRASAPGAVTRQQIGTSIQGRPIYVYRIGPEELPGTVPRRVVLIAGTHAREWITNNVVMHLAFRQLQQVLTSARGTGSRKTPILYVVPNLNPDGYEYSWNTDRMWRKNRRNNGGTFGVDLNRNYAKGWGGPGSSGNGGSSTYRGTAPFSEPETAALRDFCLSLDNFAGIIDYHSYGEYILWPWSYTSSPPQGLEAMLQVGENMRQAMVQHGWHDYTNGQASTTLYVASGTSKDYFFDEHGALSCTIELRDKGQHGFLLPESAIYDSQEEAWAGLRPFLQAL
jgi:hypothetical protein